MKNRNMISITLLVLGFLVFCELAQAVVPAPAGAYGPPSYGTGNTAEGQNALFSLGTGQYNAAIGWVSLYNLINGSFNTGVGAGTLFNNTADDNTATGAGALYANTSGGANTAMGYQALNANSQGDSNTAIGNRALFQNIAGNNTAVGDSALYSNTDGHENVAVGTGALISNEGGLWNTAVGSSAMSSNISGGANTATGFRALLNNVGDSNTACGFQALVSNSTGNGNVAMGVTALNNSNGNYNVGIGYGAGDNLTGASNVVCLGAEAGTHHQTGDNDLYLGNPGVDIESATVRVGTGDGVHTRMFLAGVRGVTTGLPDAIPVFIDSLGQLGTASSSRRYKHDIKPMDTTSEAILALKPVTFHYKSDTSGTPQFGLIAEEVAAVNPALVVRDDKGEIYTVRYDAVNAMLLNEFLKEHRKVEDQEASINRLTSAVSKQETAISQQQKGMEALTARLHEQAEDIQKVSTQIRLERSAPQQVVLKTP